MTSEHDDAAGVEVGGTTSNVAVAVGETPEVGADVGTGVLVGIGVTVAVGSGVSVATSGVEVTAGPAVMTGAGVVGATAAAANGGETIWNAYDSYVPQ